MYSTLLYIFLVFYLPVTSFAQNLKSPCPSLFQYDPQGIVGDRWYGTIRVTLETDLSGIWMRIVFDRPFLELGTDFGEAVQREPNEFLIKRPSPKVASGETLTIRIYARFDASQGAPELLGFRLNARTVCPTDGNIPPTTAAPPLLISPCPALFTYDPIDPSSDTWYGTITVTSESDLSGIWMRIILDKPPIHFGTDFGEAVQREASEYLVKNPKHKLNKGQILQYRINAKFIPGEVLPKLKAFRLNGITVCEGKNTTAAPTPASTIIYQSPCPIFKYESFASDQWIGSVNFQADFKASAFYLRLLFDKQPSDITTNFGEAVKYETTNYVIRRTTFAINNGDKIQVRFTVRFKNGEKPPKLLGFRLNGHPTCVGREEVETTTQNIREVLINPCPNVFSYEIGEENDRWYGQINYKAKVDYYGFWIQIFLDRRSVQLGNWFGEVNTDDNIGYLIKKPTRTMKTGETLRIKFYIKFDIGEPIPQLKEIRINAETICPNNDANPTSFQNPSSSIDNINWVTFPPTRAPAIDKPILGPDFQPGSTPNFAFPGFRPTSQQCGIVATQPVPLISHGFSTEEGRWPWHAALYFPSGAIVEYFCGGTLISIKHVLTVAHCATVKNTLIPLNSDNIHVYLGKYQLTKSNNGVQYKLVQRIFIHPEYTVTYYVNDIAILELSTPAEYTNSVRPVCLWSGDTNINSLVNSVGTVVGWGFDNYGRVSDKLLKAAMPVVSHSKCIWSNREFFSKTVNEKNFCAGFRNGTSVCTGDSGGGLVFPISNRWEIRGLVSLSVALTSKYTNQSSICDATQFVVFTDVAKFLDWIRNTMRQA